MKIEKGRISKRNDKVRQMLNSKANLVNQLKRRFVVVMLWHKSAR